MENNNGQVAKDILLINFFDIFGLLLLLIIAFGFQFIAAELPCPLCLLQRAGFLIIALGFALNLRFGLKPSHYSMTLLGALLTAFVALRQIALHVVPGTGGYGSSVFGLHMYTWSFIACMGILLFTSIMLGIEREYQPLKLTKKLSRLTFSILIALALIILANLTSTLLECGLKQCPENPSTYVGIE